MRIDLDSTGGGYIQELQIDETLTFPHSAVRPNVGLISMGVKDYFLLFLDITKLS